jgi:hypothetical protein
MPVSRTLVVAALVIVTSVLVGLAAEGSAGNLALLLMLADVVLVGVAVALLAERPAAAITTGAVLGAAAVGAMVFGLLLPFVLEAGDRTLDDYGSDETWHTLVLVQIFLGVPAGIIVGAACGGLGWLARRATSRIVL